MRIMERAQPRGRFFSRVSCTSLTVSEDAAAMTRPRQDDKRVRSAGRFSGSRPADPISSPRARQSPLIAQKGFLSSLTKCDLTWNSIDV